MTTTYPNIKLTDLVAQQLPVTAWVVSKDGIREMLRVMGNPATFYLAMESFTKYIETYNNSQVLVNMSPPGCRIPSPGFLVGPCEPLNIASLKTPDFNLADLSLELEEVDLMQVTVSDAPLILYLSDTTTSSGLVYPSGVSISARWFCARFKKAQEAECMKSSVAPSVVEEIYRQMRINWQTDTIWFVGSQGLFYVRAETDAGKIEQRFQLNVGGLHPFFPKRLTREKLLALALNLLRARILPQVEIANLLDVSQPWVSKTMREHDLSA